MIYGGKIGETGGLDLKLSFGGERGGVKIDDDDAKP